MRLLHTSDWHTGRSFHGAPLLDAQVKVFDAIVDIVRAERVDVVVVAGDLYDRQLPPADAVAAMSDVLARLRDAGAVVVATAGNHDSATRVGFAEQLLARQGVHLRGDPARAHHPVVVHERDGRGQLALYPIPYLEPESARHALSTPHARTHHAVLRVVCDRARADASHRPRSRSVVVAHAFVAGGAACESERVLRVGGADRVPLGCFSGFDYVALGHLHGRQVFADGRMRYSGSPLPYSFSERDQRKSVWLVDLDATGPLSVQAVDLPQPRRLAAVRGDLADLLRERRWDTAQDCWVQATLTDQLLPRDAMGRLRARFPHAVVLAHEPPVAPGTGPRRYSERVRGRTDAELVNDFFDHVTGQALTGDERQLCDQVLNDVLSEIST